MNIDSTIRNVFRPFICYLYDDVNDSVSSIFEEYTSVDLNKLFETRPLLLIKCIREETLKFHSDIISRKSLENILDHFDIFILVDDLKSF